MAAVRAFAALPRLFEVRFAVAVFASLALLVAGPAYAQTEATPPKASAVSQYTEMTPGAGGARPSEGKAAKPSAGNAKPTTAKPGARKAVAAGRADPVSAAFTTSGGGLGGGSLLAIILGASAAVGALLFAVRRRLSRRQPG